MPTLATYRGRDVGLLGFARSGEALACALVRAGARPVIFDDSPEAQARAAAAGYRLGRAEAVARLAALVPSPGVPLTHPQPHPLIAAARKAGVPILGDIQLFADSRPDLVLVGVTGTNGKSTTAALLHHLLRGAGRRTLLGGNIGEPVFSLEPGSGDTVVLELSSFQLDLCTDLRCRVAVWLNLTPDHLDRHGSLEGYVAAKARLFEQQRPEDRAVVAIDDAISRAQADRLGAAGRAVVRVSGGETRGVEVGFADETLIDRLGDGEVRFHLAGRLRLRGLHNRQNIAAAYATARLLGHAPEPLIEALCGFPGLAHRMEEVGRIGRVLFVNDSKATNPDAVARSLAAFEDVFWIAGGRPKPGGFDSLRPATGAVRAGYFIGEAAEALASSFAGLFPVEVAGTLDRALDAAFAAARRSDRSQPVVLLAPACASFDQFRDFAARGDRFRELVDALVARQRLQEAAP